MSNSLSRFRPVLEAFNADHIDQCLHEELELQRSGALSVMYAPFDHIASKARLVVVGITPGRVQAVSALNAAASALRRGRDLAEASRLAKQTASFSGNQTRTNLVAMLDAIGLAEKLSIQSCSQLFSPESEEIHFTSALRYPVFVSGENYRGNPDMIRTPCLRSMIDTYLSEEAQALKSALWLPLGPKPMQALRYLASKGELSESQILEGMPHPSGLNGERVSAFLGRIAPGQSSVNTKPEKLLAARAELRMRVARHFG